jgi:hypothetical protein
VLSAGDPVGIDFSKSLARQTVYFYICGAATDVYRLHPACADSRYLSPSPQDRKYLNALNRLTDDVEQLIRNSLRRASVNRGCRGQEVNRDGLSDIISNTRSITSPTIKRRSRSWRMRHRD